MTSHFSIRTCARLLATSFLIGFGAAAGCANSDHPAGLSGGSGDQHLPGTESCDDGTTRDCHVTIGERNGIVSCLNGAQSCDAGKWSDCEGSDISTMSAPAWYQTGGLHAQALSTAGDCNPEDPCDPSCQQYDENPPLPLGPNSTDGGTFMSSYDWTWGSLSSFPGGLVKKGLIEPCHTAYDCQFNEFCQYPDAGTCSHDMCSTGTALAASCDDADSTRSCTQMICDIDSTCCTATSCAHSLCASGTKLKSGCGTDSAEQTCSALVCTNKPSCCSGTWDSTCVDAVNTYCKAANYAQCNCGAGQTLHNNHCYKAITTAAKWTQADCTTIGSGWYLAHISTQAENTAVAGLSASELWIGASASTPAAAIWKWADDASTVVSPGAPVTLPSWTNNHALFINSANDGWSNAGNNSVTKAYACEGQGSVYAAIGTPTSNTWSASCVSKVKTVCGAVCDTTNPPASTGDCAPYPAGYQDASCNSWNLTVAPTCEGAIPVCNHGTVQAPAGLKIYSFQGNSDHYPWCNPTIQNNDNNCTTTEVIPAGECISVTGCTLDNNGEVIINPTTAPGYVSGECDCKDNWSLVKSSSAACSAPGCGTADGFYSGLVSACEAAVPNADYEDGTAVTLSHVYDDNKNNTTDDPVTFTYLSSATGCAATPLGWYYNADKSKFELCTGTGSACARVQDVQYVSSDVYVELACNSDPQYEETSFLNTYTGTCGTDQGVQWADLTYTGTIPSDATVEFRVAASATQAGLPTNDPTDPGWTVAQVATTATQSCPAGSTCAIDLFDALGGVADGGTVGDSQLLYLAVLITLVPSTDNQAPVITNWDITYSCPYNQ